MMREQKIGMAAVVAAGLALGACSSDDGQPPPADSTPRAEARVPDSRPADGPAREAGAVDAAAVKFATHVQPIFSASCASATCHGGASPKAGMSLESGQAYASLVNVTSAQCPTLKRVTPGQPEQSYLVQKIEGAGTCFTGNKMPVGGSLQSGQVATIRAWITAGALDD